MCRNDQRNLTRREFLASAGAGAALLATGCSSADRSSGPVRSAGEAPPPIDPADWDALAHAVLRELRRGGASYGDVRVVQTTRQTVAGEDGRISSLRTDFDRGFGVRALVDGAWGFAASSVIDGAEARRVARMALEIARGSATLSKAPVVLAPEPVHRDEVITPREVDPLSVSVDEKAALLSDVMDRLHRHSDRIRRSRARFWTQRDEKLFASTEGTHLRFDLIACQAGFQATAVVDGVFEARSYGSPYLRRGYENVTEARLPHHAERVAAEAIEKAAAPTVRPGTYDLVLDPEHLALTIHESCGHPTELDRALGYEANYAGTSFLTPEKLGRFRYGSPEVSLVADNTEPGGLASTGYDDDGVACQRWDIVRDGTFVGYSSNREVAPRVGLGRSRGSNRADSWDSIPIVRIANIGLEPGDASPDELIAGVKRGILIEGEGSFSIDQKRYNFQFGGDAFWLIENGQRKGMLRDVIYTGITPEFWNACDGVASAAHRKRYGFITCGKGQPGQSGWMTHAAAPARFRGINVIRGGEV